MRVLQCLLVLRAETLEVLTGTSQLFLPLTVLLSALAMAQLRLQLQSPVCCAHLRLHFAECDAKVAKQRLVRDNLLHQDGLFLLQGLDLTFEGINFRFQSG